jgi:hypothetical protein
MPNTFQPRQDWRIHLTPPISKESYKLVLLGIESTFELEPEYVLDHVREHLNTKGTYEIFRNLTDEQIRTLLEKPLSEKYYIDGIKAQIRFGYITTLKTKPSEIFLSDALSSVKEWAEGHNCKTMYEIHRALHNQPYFAKEFWDLIEELARKD